MSELPAEMHIAPDYVFWPLQDPSLGNILKCVQRCFLGLSHSLSQLHADQSAVQGANGVLCNGAASMWVQMSIWRLACPRWVLLQWHSHNCCIEVQAVVQSIS